MLYSKKNLDFVAIPYQKDILELAVGDLQLKFARVSNFDELLDELIAKGSEHPDYSDDRIPYWADLWHSALGLATYLKEQQVVVEGMSVTEIGCGLGLPGLVAGLMGGELTFTDYLPEALDMARYNWALNLQRPARFMTMDWRQPQPEAAAQLLLASDVAYERRAFEPLMHTFDALGLAGGRLILTEPNRPVASPWLEALGQRYPEQQRSQIKQEYRGVVVSINVVDIRF